MYEENEIEDYAPWLAIIITLIGGALRVFLLTNKGLWLEETFSVWMSHHSIAEILQWTVKIDQHPPLYYLLLHFWVKLNGDRPYDVRLLSALFSTATIPMIYLTGKRLSGVVMGLAAAVILALSPFNIRFAQETRMYSLLTFNAAVAIYALARLLTDSQAGRPIGSQFREYLHAWRTSGPAEPDSKGDLIYKDETRNLTGWRARIFRHRWLPIQSVETDLAWLAFILFSAATMLSHNTAVFFPLAINIFVLGLMLFKRIKKSSSPALQAPTLGNWVKAQFVIFLLWSPWMIGFIKQASRVYQQFWIPVPGWDTVIQTLRSFINESMQVQASLGLIIWILYALVLCLGLVHYKKKISRFIFLGTLFAVPFLGELLVSIRRPIFLDRTLIWTTIPLFLLLAAGIAQLRFRLLIILVLGIFSTINLFSAGDYYRFVQKEDWEYPAGYVSKFVQKDDLVLFHATWVKIPFDYYFKAYEELYSIQIEKHGVPVDLFDSGILEPKMMESDIPGLISLLSGHMRVWLVYSHASNTDPMGLIPQTLAAEMKLIRERDFNGVLVQLYEAP